MILLIDNYDSFTFNLRRYLVQLGQQVCVVRNDDNRLEQDLKQYFAAMVISPGPRAPQDAGLCLRLTRQWSGQIPILGVCLGHQVIYEACGGAIVRALRPVHGQSTPMELLPSPIFEGIATGTRFARYHSLVGGIACVPKCLQVIAWSEEREIMAVAHREHPTYGVQFHPESVLSLAGHRLLRNFLVSANLPVLPEMPDSDLADPGQANASAGPLPEPHSVVLPKATGKRETNQIPSSSN